MDYHKERIKGRIREAIQQFRDGTIDYSSLASNIAGNIKALDNLDKSIESAAIRLCGKLDIIHYTVDTDKEHDDMIDEVKRFEPYIDKI
jgi:hypothetical protein